MAYTKIKPIHTTLNRSIDYVLNPEKTGLENALDYAMNREKNETGCFQSAFNCRVDHAHSDMMATRKRWGKDGGRHVLGYHIIQSFHPGEVTPEQAHELGKEFARRCLAERYEVVVSTHLDRQHLHNHIVFNAVSFADGGMYRNNFKDYFGDIRGISDALCKEYGLSVIEPEEDGSSAKHYSEWQADQRGDATWRGLIRQDVDAAIERALSMSQFAAALRAMGYELKTNVKHMAVRPPGKERFVRLRSLGENYTEEAIRQRILNRTTLTYSASTPLPVSKSRLKGQLPRNTIKLKGLRALYFRYLYQLGAIQKRPSGKRTAFLLREDLLKLDSYIEQMRLLGREHIETPEQLAAYREAVETRMADMAAARSSIHSQKKGINDAEKKQVLSQQAGEITAEIKAMRRERSCCDVILQNAVAIQEKLHQAMAKNQQPIKEELKHEPGSRRR